MVKKLDSFENKLNWIIEICPEMFPFSVSPEEVQHGVFSSSFKLLYETNIDYLYDYYGSQQFEEVMLFRKRLTPFVLFAHNNSLQRFPNRKELLTFQLFLFTVLSDKKFLESKYKIETAAKDIGINKNYLSGAISKCCGNSFTAIINIYRIAYAQYLISKDILIQINLEEIALKCGFNNRTTFYRVFVDIVGKIPSGFRHEQNLDFIQ